MVQALFMRLHGCVLDASSTFASTRQCLIRNRRGKLGQIWLARRVQRIMKPTTRAMALPNGGRTTSVIQLGLFEHALCMAQSLEAFVSMVGAHAARSDAAEWNVVLGIMQNGFVD